MVTNKTGDDLVNGQLVYISGAQGNRPTIALAKANSHVTAHASGMLTEDIANNTNGFINLYGLVRNVNTLGYSSGDHLYLSADTAGDYTNVAPKAPNHRVRIGTIIDVNELEGVILTRFVPSLQLSDLTDVNGITPDDANKYLV